MKIDEAVSILRAPESKFNEMIQKVSRPKDDCLTVVFRGLTSDEKREIIYRHEAVHLRHGNGLEERKELDRIAIALQAEIEALRAEVERDKALLRQCLELLLEDRNALYECHSVPGQRGVPVDDEAVPALLRYDDIINSIRNQLGGSA